MEEKWAHNEHSRCIRQKKEEIKITKLKYFCLFEIFQNKMHKKKSMQNEKQKTTKTK